MSHPLSQRVSRLVKISLAFHNINKTLESEIGLSLVQYHLLHHLRDRPGISPQVLAKVAGMHASTLTQSLKRLSKKGLLYVGDDPKDSRKKLITLTASGKAAIDRFEAMAEQILPPSAPSIDSANH